MWFLDVLAIALVFFLGVPLLAVVVWLCIRASRAQDQLTRLELRLKLLQDELRQLKAAERPRAVAAEKPSPDLEVARIHAEAVEEERRREREKERPRPTEAPLAGAARAPEAPAAKAAPPPAPEGLPAPADGTPVRSLPVAASVARAAQTPTAGKPGLAERINWEKFLGVNLFAWVGGLALFLGLAFFLKYSFENNLISPALRIAIGYVAGIGLMLGGLRLSRERHAVTVQTLCATATVILYASTFSAHSYYHFIAATPTFGLMALTTAAAFLLAVRLNAQVVAILGLLGLEVLWFLWGLLQSMLSPGT
jgi:uncharacterized membrane protein